MGQIDLAKKFFLRDIIGNYMYELGKKDLRVLVINADLMGTCRTTKFVNEFPQRSFNVGIAEQNMISFSAGLAHEGYFPYAFSMAPFISMRACEQCRTDVAYANLNVRLVASYAGCSGGISGATHWGMEDCSIMSGMANMVVLEPSDPVQAMRMLDSTLNYFAPIYIRSSIVPVPQIYDNSYQFEIGKASLVKPGSDGTFICSGVVVQYALQAALQIESIYGKNIQVLDFHTFKPIDRQAVIDASKTGTIVVAQDHNIIGGLGYQVASVLVEEGISVRFKNLGIPDQFFAMAHPDWLYHKFGYDTEGLISAMTSLLGI